METNTLMSSFHKRDAYQSPYTS